MARAQNSVMKYRGYIARLAYDANDNLFVGEVVGLTEPIEFHGASVDELRGDFEFAIDHYLRECELEGIKPERPASGKILLRLAPEQHARALVAAESAGISLNEWLSGAVNAALDA
jgi:predicted HicB family RNase H-like nuclease